MTPNATFSAWSPDDDTGGSNDSAGRYVRGASPSFYMADVPCTVQSVSRSEVRDATSGSIMMEPGRLSCDKDFTLFELGDYVEVSAIGLFDGRVGEIRRINWSARGRRRAFLYLQWLQSTT